ncbi:MAG: endonuclease/exonuclease/phosphatase family protein [Candidatus Pacebacteria bacterium]|nr:endonuclease/exonuclease/phosphatase family protein [Candidatus Paceibacterota bacterium]
MLKLLSINIEGHKHLDRWLPVVKKLQPDVLCLQEIFASDVTEIGTELNMSVQMVPTVDVSKKHSYTIEILGESGLAILTNLPATEVEVSQYGGPEEIGFFQEPNDGQRFLIQSTVTKDGKKYSVATTHFTWSNAGQATKLQHEDFSRLKPIIESYDELILCGDFNVPRGGEIFSKFTELLNDNLPEKYTTTIDEKFHYAGKLDLVVDTIFSTNNYRVNNCHPINGLSDHMGVWGEVVKG